MSVMNKRSYPKVSVVMSVYNGEIYLQEAVDSILNQTFENFEFLIVDDGSTDRTLNILQSYKDPRIKVINNKKNIGLTASLNKGLKIAKWEYIARMDADDVSFPHRLEQQKAFLDRNPQVAVVGSWVEVIDESGKTQKTWRTLTRSHLLRWRLLFKNTFAHPAVMFRKGAVLQMGGYDEYFKCAQDYELWSRLSSNWEVTNIPEVLLKWRRRENSISAVRQKDQKEIAKEVSRRNLEYILDKPLDDATFRSFRVLYDFSGDEFDPNRIHDLTSNIRMLMSKFITKYGYRDESVARDLKAELSTRMLYLLEINAFSAGCGDITLHYWLVLLYWLVIFDPYTPKMPLLRILKAILRKNMVKKGKILLNILKLWRQPQGLGK